MGDFVSTFKHKSEDSQGLKGDLAAVGTLRSGVAVQ